MQGVPTRLRGRAQGPCRGRERVGSERGGARARGPSRALIAPPPPRQPIRTRKLRRKVEGRQLAREELARAAIAAAPVSYAERDGRTFAVKHLPATVAPGLRELQP